MTTLFDQPQPIADGALGVIGDRELVAVQTFYIARLTSHPVGIVPSAFVAVTGRGPRDSNESGKTSFNAAVSLLLGDPEWRVTGGGVAAVAQLLFEPDTAGVAATRYPAADTGFIIGVFAYPDDPVSTAHTVWMKLSSTPKYVQVRHCAGVQIVDAENDVERHRLAPAKWKALPATDLGAHSYVETLYGHSPRCLAYVAARGKQRSGPSLLKMDTGAFSPEDIGVALVRLTGRSEALEFEQDQRRKLAKQLEELESTKAQHEQRWTAEEAIAEGVRTRKKIRAALDDGETLWRQHLARGLLDTIGRREMLDTQTRQAAADVKTLSKELRERQAREKELSDDTSVHERAIDAQEAFNRADQDLSDAKRQETTLLNKLSTLRDQMIKLEERGARSSPPDVDAAKQALENRKVERTKSAVAVQTKTQVVDDLQIELAHAEEGRTGEAGRSISALSDSGIVAVGLLDAIEVAEEHRAVWEPRLHPWRDAVCIDQHLRDDALAALAGHAGTILIAGEATDVFPDGILAAPPPARRFLAELASRVPPAEIEGVDAVHDVELGVTVLGGFGHPTTGRVQLVRALQARLAQAESKLVGFIKADKLAVAREAQAIEDLDAAEAAVEYQQCHDERTGIEKGALPEISVAVRELADKRETTLEVLTAAKAQVQGIEAARSQARSERQQMEKDLASAKKDYATTHQALEAAALTYWRSGLPGGESDARLILNWAEQPVDYDVQRGLVRPTDPRNPALPAVIRSREILANRANDELNAILNLLGVQRDTGEGAPTGDIGEAVRHRDRLDDRNHVPSSHDEASFTVLASALKGWLTQHVERDQLAEEQIETARQERSRERAYIEDNLMVMEQSVTNVQDSLEQRVEDNLMAIRDALNELNRSAGGYGATLHCEVFRPIGPGDTWTWRVTPAWQRSPGGRMLPYDNATNTAQEKLFSIHLVLAALLASPNPRGRVLILDELGDSLGDEHRRDVLSAVAKVARIHGITVLGTCQDAVMPDAASYCGEVLYFCYPSKADALNLPTRMFGFDDNSERVELSAEHLLVGRHSR
ncbi:hypothetical protein [Nocardia australiensis]|uniref:hypothetical protein n=1 Tax=Nocardia australiensis TaxID=2887191 RepID=UPI001D14AC27|nr:hypothetical protein [Nocardia australiensis]